MSLELKLGLSHFMYLSAGQGHVSAGTVSGLVTEPPAPTPAPATERQSTWLAARPTQLHPSSWEGCLQAPNSLLDAVSVLPELSFGFTFFFFTSIELWKKDVYSEQRYTHQPDSAFDIQL